MQEKLQSITQRITELLDPLLQEYGFELVDMDFVSDQGRRVLRLFIDRPEGGITIDDCAEISTEFSQLLDVKDVIEQKFVLEVSSPGLDRPLKKEKDFQKAVGRKIKVKTRAAILGRQHYTGCLAKFEEGIMHLEVDGNPVALPWQEIEKANLVYEFDRQSKKKNGVKKK